MKYERYTSKDWAKDKYAVESYKRLAELEDKIEQGTLIELPCKIGDKIYYIFTYGNNKFASIEEGKVKSFIVMADNNVLIDVMYNDFGDTHFIKNFGSDLFLTRTEAEVKLKELQEQKEWNL